VLTVGDLLATAAGEKAIRGQADAVRELPPSILAPIHRVDRIGDALELTVVAPDGVRLSSLLDQLQRGTLLLDEQGVLDVIMRVIRSVAVVHAAPGFIAHGAITPAHVIVDELDVVLTDAVFAPSLQALQWNRERMWRTFGVALPWSASLNRFDQRTDVCQLGAVALAIALRRPLAVEEYPHGVEHLVAAAAERFVNGPALRAWLYRALHLHTRGMFASALEAGQAFAELMAFTTSRLAPSQPLPPRSTPMTFRHAPST